MQQVKEQGVGEERLGVGAAEKTNLIPFLPPWLKGLNNRSGNGGETVRKCSSGRGNW